jgi:ribosomal protein S2
MTDGKATKEEKFVEEIARMLGAYATTNQYLVGTLTTQLKQKNLLISKLEAKVATVKENVRDEVRRSLEEAQTTDLHEIEKLRSDLE